jgi:BirA family biotin operon repressor/biotin-[acetyl-CoA-carboxylase] ligase
LSPEKGVADLELIAEKILNRIRSKPGQPFGPAKLSAILKIPPDTIIPAIGLLRNWGYVIKADKEGRYIFVSAPDSFISTEISRKLNTRQIGQKIYAYRTVQSTNAIASQLAQVGIPEGTLVIAESQTRGRGRLGRHWHSPAKVGLYCSIILYPKIHPTLAPGISLMTAAALADTIASYDDIDVKIKWPNDILISGRKTAGILTELSAEIDQVTYVIVGVGININQMRTDFPSDLKDEATSVRIGAKEKIKRVDFLQRFLRNFEREYVSFKKYGLGEIRKKILKYSFLHNKEIRLRIGRKVISGIVIDIDRNGQLVIDTKDGIMAFNAGEVTTHRESKNS